jgi:hypothetical protein
VLDFGSDEVLIPLHKLTVKPGDQPTRSSSGNGEFSGSPRLEAMVGANEFLEVLGIEQNPPAGQEKHEGRQTMPKNQRVCG